MRIKARDYQKECLAEIAKAVESDKRRALVVMAPALGKTITSAFAIKEFFAGRIFSRVLILCHSEEILRQTKKVYQKFFGEEFSYGMYVSNEKTARQTDFLFATFQTMKENRKDFSKDEFAFIVVDEAHHSKARTYFPTIRYFKPEFLLGLTATPDRLDGQDIREIYGDPIYELDFVEATCRGLVAECDYELVLDDLSQEDVDQYLQSDEKLSIAQLNKTIFAPKRDEEIVRLIKQYSSEQDDPKTMIFCKGIEHVRRIAKLMGDDVAIVHNGQSDSSNKKALNAFRDGKIRTIISVQKLNEGVDVPDASVIVFLRNTVSPTVFYQQLGRGIRLSPGKKKVKVLDFVGNCERIQTILRLKQEIDDFRTQTPVEKTYTHGDGEADSREKFTLNIATPEFKSRMVDIIEMLKNVRTWHHLNPEELISSLQDLAKQLGRSPYVTDVGKNGLPAFQAYANAFGSWNKALKAAGLELNTNRGEYTEERLLWDLRDLAEELGRTPVKRDLKGRKTASVRKYVQVFGSWNDALKAAGFTINQSKDISDQALIDYMHDYVERLGYLPTTSEYLADESVTYSYYVYLNHFGNWKNVMKLACSDGVRVYKTHNTKEQLAIELRDFTMELGRLPMRKEVDDNKKLASSETYSRHFSRRWKEVLRLAGATDVLITDATN